MSVPLTIGLTRATAEAIIRASLPTIYDIEFIWAEDAEYPEISTVKIVQMIEKDEKAGMPISSGKWNYNWSGKWDILQKNGSVAIVELERIPDTNYYWITYTSDRGIERIQRSFDDKGNSDFGKLMNRRDLSFSGEKA